MAKRSDAPRWWTIAIAACVAVFVADLVTALVGDSPFEDGPLELIQPAAVAVFIGLLLYDFRRRRADERPG